MRKLQHGVYEELITRGLARALRDHEAAYGALTAELESVDSYVPFAQHLNELIVRAFAGLPERERVDRQVAICNRLIDLLREEAPRAFDGLDDSVEAPARTLLALIDPRNPIERAPNRPTIPLAQSALLTNALGEPAIGSEISRELESADAVDLICAFVRWYGIRTVLESLRAFFARGGTMRLVTTTYMGATERHALDALCQLGAEVKVSYETRTTRLHAKAWLFRRGTGLNTGFIGSSNLSKSALVDGIEWNVRISSVDNPKILDKFDATFNSYWQSEHFEPYDPARDARRFDRAVSSEQQPETSDVVHFDIRPYPYQERILEELQVERERHNRWRNLVVAATGTGKTVIAALDYRRLRAELKQARLLFVAHRKEILEQSLRTFRTVLRDGSFGELYVDGHRPDDWQHVFASIQSLAAIGATTFDSKHFDVVIVDEFHHAAARTYRALLDHVEPRVLLGLTATPERTDTQDVTEWFGGRLATELRLWEALDEGLLCPFQYFGIHDDVALDGLEWKRGGYQVADLDHIYTGNDARAAKILRALQDQIPAWKEMRALGFCVSIAHAEYMARTFSAAGVPSEAISAQSSTDERDQSLRRLRDRAINAIFAVDIFNEGVDVPEIDTVMLLRPTESATVFLQQLGRGLRHAEGKACLTVLDFIGQQHRRFRFDRRYRALLGQTRGQIRRQVEEGFPFLPAGCHISLDRVARSVVLENVRRALQLNYRDLALELRALGDVSLATFLRETDVELVDVYRVGGWMRLRREAGFETPKSGPDEDRLARSLGRLLHVDDPERLTAWRRVLSSDASLGGRIDARQRRLLAMLHFNLWGLRPGFGLEEGLDQLRKHPAVVGELKELFELLEDRAPTLPHQFAELADVPLFAHSRYTRDEILAAIGSSTPETPREIREGVFYDREYERDLFFITLQKTEAHFSPTTLYRDYAISPQLFHWESQSTTSQGSAAGQRYLSNSNPLLFVRETRLDDLGKAKAYMFLGSATYVAHSGDRPIAISWRLTQPMPMDFYEIARLAAS